MFANARGAAQGRPIEDERQARAAYQFIMVVASAISICVATTSLLMGLRTDKKIELAAIGSFFPILLLDCGLLTMLCKYIYDDWERGIMWRDRMGMVFVLVAALLWTLFNCCFGLLGDRAR